MGDKLGKPPHTSALRHILYMVVENRSHEQDQNQQFLWHLLKPASSLHDEQVFFIKIRKQNKNKRNFEHISQIHVNKWKGRNLQGACEPVSQLISGVYDAQEHRNIYYETKTTKLKFITYLQAHYTYMNPIKSKTIHIKMTLIVATSNYHVFINLIN